MPLKQRVQDFFKRQVDRLVSFGRNLRKKAPNQEAKGADNAVTTENAVANGKTVAPSQPFLSEPQELKSQTPVIQRQLARVAGSQLPIALVNRTGSSDVYVYIIGLALSKNNAWFLLQSDGSTPYYPTSPSSTGQPLRANVAIKLGAPGSTRTVTIPQLAGGRIFVSVGSPLTFLLNPGPALVEPSVTNPTDPNINVSWSFAEFTFNGSLYANISYVDFVGIPIALQLQNTSGATQTVPGIPANGLDTICSKLQEQSNSDGVAGWRNLVVKQNGTNLRALSPNSGLEVRRGDFANYFEPYVNEVWQRYTNSPLTIRTADNVLNTSGKVAPSNGKLTINNVGFGKPTTADIFSSNTGPFATDANQARNVLIPQLSAAFNRTTLLQSSTTPAPAASFYNNRVTNHYARIVHAANTDKRGYAFPYDDVNSAEGKDQSGFVNDPNPQLLTVTFGGL